MGSTISRSSNDDIIDSSNINNKKKRSKKLGRKSKRNQNNGNIQQEQHLNEDADELGDLDQLNLLLSGCLNHNNDKSTGDGCCQHSKTVISKPKYKIFRNTDIVDSLYFPIDQSSQIIVVESLEESHQQQIKDSHQIETIEIDMVSSLSHELQTLILSFIGHGDVVAMQSTCKYWYNVGRDPRVWRDMVKRDMHASPNKENINLVVNNYATSNIISWKRVYCDLYRLRICKMCATPYRQFSNSKQGCKVHSDIRDIVHSRGVPSGVYWICCLAKPKDAAGCMQSYHYEQDETNYP